MTDSTILAINYIAKTEGFRHGEPHFADRHLAVEIVVHSIVNLGASIEDMVQAYELTPAQVHAALAYYYDHIDEFKKMWMERDRTFAEHAEEDAQRHAELLANAKERNPALY